MPTDSRPGVLVPVLIGCVVLAGSIAFSAWLRQAETRGLERATQARTQRVAQELEGRIEDQIRALVRLGRRCERRGKLRREDWEDDARDLSADFGNIQAIEWVDRSFRVRWIVPLEGNEAAQGLALGFEEERRRALELSRDHHEVMLSRPVELVQGGHGFLVYVPLLPGGEFDGFVVGVYRTAASFEAILRNLARGFEIEVRDETGPLWSRGIPAQAIGTARPAPIAVRNLRWTVAALPGAAVVAAHRTALPWLAAIGGAVSAGCLAFVVHLARTRRWRVAQLFAANRRLTAEIEGRAEAEVAERATREELAAVVNSLPDHVWSARLEPGGKLVARYYSEVIERISARPAGLFRDNPAAWLDIVHPEDRAKVAEAYRKVLPRPGDGFSLEYRIERPDGEVRWVRDRVQSRGNRDDHRIDGMISDITELKRVEEERRRLEMRFHQAQRLESLGVLAGGIAHDFNNLLTAVIGHARLSLQDLPEGSPVARSLHSIDLAGRRAAELCRQMLAYTGKASFVIEPVALASLVEEMGELLGATISKKISLAYDFDEAASTIDADALQIRQVVMNLITNAAEAIGDRAGRIELAVHATRCSEEDLAAADLVEGLSPCPCVALVVKDDGCGMDELTKRRIFEPFYTTKFTGRGLGLAAVLGILRGHRGAIRVESEPGRGTTVTLLFPEGTKRTAHLESAAVETSAWRGHGTLLVVDDEEVARALAERVFARAGFEVLTAVDGVEALALFRERGDDIRGVLLDLTMPRMDGCETHRKLRALRPDLPVVLCSGYPELDAAERFAGFGLSAFLEKPYTPEALVAAMRRALAEAAPGA